MFSTCALCGCAAADLCTACRAELPRIDVACAHCGLPLPHAGFCGRCLLHPPAFARCIAPLRYEAPVSQLIGAFKYRRALHSGRLLSALLAERLQHERGGCGLAVDRLVPVPLHWRRRFARGFNQAEVIADELGRALGVPLDTRALRRCRHAPPQQGLAAAARRRNLRSAFRCGDALRDLHVALIDDVVTTTATADEIARTLLAAGVASVQVWCLARTP